MGDIHRGQRKFPRQEVAMDSPKITSVDIGIIRCLHRDARQSFVKIAADLKVPESTVRHRLNRLMRHGIVEFSAVTNPLRMGYQSWAIIEIQGQPSRIRGIAEELAKVPEVFFVGITTGEYDILVNAVFPSNAELLHFLTTRLSKIRGVTRTATSTLLDVVKRRLTLDFPDPTTNGGGATKTAPRRKT
jgi:Lrp/AsnC family transcriptional regulator for asnA, asnC and gidA